jgi:hypothetical protein
MHVAATGIERRTIRLVRRWSKYIVVAKLKAGRAAEAERELAAGPPFDPADAGLSRHAAYLTDQHVYVLFEGQAARTAALRLAREHLVEVRRWGGIVSGLRAGTDGVPPEARCVYSPPAESR